MADRAPATAPAAGSAIRAAGGLLWRERDGRAEIALIHRHRHDDWTLPKGNVEAGESYGQAALREVREETGYLARLGRFAGALAYTVGGRPKVVRYWHMWTVDRSASPVDASEVTEVAWLTPVEALERLTYPLERALLEACAEERSPGP